MWSCQKSERGEWAWPPAREHVRFQYGKSAGQLLGSAFCLSLLHPEPTKFQLLPSKLLLSFLWQAHTCSHLLSKVLPLKRPPMSAPLSGPVSTNSASKTKPRAVPMRTRPEESLVIWSGVSQAMAVTKCPLTYFNKAKVKRQLLVLKTVSPLTTSWALSTVC